MKHFYLLVFFCSFFFFQNASAQLYINEWMASNSSTISDPDFDASGDWVELYNGSNQIIELSGYFLSDNFSEPTKWVFPSGTTIAAQQFLLVWADGENTGLHTTFKLTKDGEELGLYNRDTLLLDSIVYSFQSTDISMGRKTDGSSDLGFFSIPSPNSSNNNSPAFTGLTFYTPHFSQRGGFFNNPISVELSAIDGQIRYTLDGSLPTENSQLYNGLIPLQTTTVVRARVFQSDFLPGPPITQSYFFNENFDTRALPIVSISTDPAFFWDSAIGLYVQNFKPEWEYPINIELFENDGSNRSAFNAMAGVKVNGQNAWELPQKMLGIYFDNEYGDNNIDYPLFMDRPRRKYDNFILRASGSDWSSTLFRDGLMQGLTEPNMDLHISGFRPAIVYVNGAYMGIHNIRSRVDEGYIEETFGQAKGSFDLINNDGEVEEGDAVDYASYFAKFDTDLSQTTNYQAVESILDIRNFTDYFISEIYSSNSSWGHNILLWKSKAPNSKWRYILQDLDRGFTGSYDDYVDQFSTSNSPAYYNWARKPLRALLQNSTFSNQFISRFSDHLYTTFHPETVNKAIFERENAIKAEIPYHVGRWAGTTSNYGDGIASVGFWENEVQALHTFAYERQANLLNYLQTAFNLQAPVSLGIFSLPADAGQVSLNTINLPKSNWVGPYFAGLPIQLEAKPKLGHKFLGWFKASQEVLIPKESVWKYLDTGSDQGTAWTSTAFNDSAWSQGQAELGYGDGGENTTVSYGSSANNKFITTYFRKTITVQDATAFTGQFVLNLRRDDGAVVYLNGVEIVRSNMPAGPITSATKAVETVGGAAEESFSSFSIQSSALKTGANVLAVEIHQVDGSSSDISFDLELVGITANQSTLLASAQLLDLDLSSDTFLIAKFEATSVCILPQTVSTNTTLSLACSPYFVPTDVHVLKDVNLTIEAGVELHFAENAGILVEGAMEVNGTALAPVRFKAAAGSADWASIIFHNTADTSRLNWLELTAATQGQHPYYENAAISAFHANLELDHVVIVDVKNNPIIGYYSSVSVKNSRLHSEVTGDLINVKYGSGLVENTELRGNNQIDTDAIDFDEVENGIIKGNKIYDFFGYNSDGIDLGEASKNVHVTNNFIHNCSDKGISVGQRSSIIAENNTIVNCSKGFGIKDVSSAEVDQQTFYNVATPLSVYEKNIGQGGGTAFISNSILSNSPLASYGVDTKSFVEFSYSLSDTDSLPGSTNLFGNPRFVNPTQNDFHLKSNSSALNSGLNGMGISIDLGTKSHLYGAPASVQMVQIQYNPATNSNAEFIVLQNPSTVTVDLTGYVLSEGIDFVFPSTQIAAGEQIIIALDASLFLNLGKQVFQWTAGKLSNSGETIRLTDASDIIVDQVTYDDELPWPTEADGQGAWLALFGLDLDNHFAESWVTNTVSAKEPSETDDFKVLLYPNPTSGLLQLVSNQKAFNQIIVLNLVGQEVYRSTLDKVTHTVLDLSQLANGVYFLKVDGQRSAHKIVLLK